MSSNTTAHYFGFLKIAERSPRQLGHFWNEATCSEGNKEVLNTSHSMNLLARLRAQIYHRVAAGHGGSPSPGLCWNKVLRLRYILWIRPVLRVKTTLLVKSQHAFSLSVRYSSIRGVFKLPRHFSCSCSTVWLRTGTQTPWATQQWEQCGGPWWLGAGRLALPPGYQAAQQKSTRKPFPALPSLSLPSFPRLPREFQQDQEGSKRKPAWKTTRSPKGELLQIC